SEGTAEAEKRHRSRRSEDREKGDRCRRDEARPESSEADDESRHGEPARPQQRAPIAPARERTQTEKGRRLVGRGAEAARERKQDRGSGGAVRYASDQPRTG